MINQDFHYSYPNVISYTHNSLQPSRTAHRSYCSESHRMVELMLIVQGKMSYLIDGVEFTAEAGDMVVINEGEFHSSHASHLTFCEKLILHFATTYIPTFNTVNTLNAFTNAAMYQHVIPKEFVHKTKILSLFKKIETMCKRDEKYKDLKLVSLIQSIVAEINIAVDAMMLTKNYIIPTTVTDEPFQDAINYINANITKDVTPSVLSEYLGMSASYLQRLFKKNMGISIHNYIQNQKMQLALSLLRKGHPAKLVAQMVGYEYYATFYNAFKNVFGQPPSQFE